MISTAVLAVDGTWNRDASWDDVPWNAPAADALCRNVGSVRAQAGDEAVDFVLQRFVRGVGGGCRPLVGVVDAHHLVGPRRLGPVEALFRELRGGQASQLTVRPQRQSWSVTPRAGGAQRPGRVVVDANDAVTHPGAPLAAGG